MINKFLTLVFMFISGYSFAQCSGLSNTVNIIQAPIGSLVPDVVMDNNGILHMVYAKNQNAYYVRSTDNGTTFSVPVKVNLTGSVEYKMGERGPKISVGSDGVIHIAWMDLWSSGVNTFARYTRSTDGGLTFEAPKAVSVTTGIDGVTLAADGNNNVVVFWHVMAPIQTTIPEATWLHMSRSINNGVSFITDTNVVINNHSGLACTMCMTRARFGIDGKVYLLFRSAENNIRDFYVLKGYATQNNFTAIRVNSDNWNINYCPMVGPELEISNSGLQYCAFMSDSHVYWTVSDSSISNFTLHVPTPLSETDEIYPTAIANNSGKVLFVWQVGPMSISDSATVKCALYNSDGSFTGQECTIGRTFSGTKATVFVGTDDNFYVILNTNNLTTDLKIHELSNISILSNPNEDLISITGIKCTTRINIYNMFGQIVLDKEVFGNTIISTNDLMKGIYVIEAISTDNSECEKLLITKF